MELSALLHIENSIYFLPLVKNQHLMQFKLFAAAVAHSVLLKDYVVDRYIRHTNAFYRSD